MRHLYSLSVYALMAVLFLYFLLRSFREPDYRKRWNERLGHVTVTRGAIWIHAASVGEVQAVTPLIDALLQRDAGLNILLTTFTPTGSKLVSRRIQHHWGNRVQHCYLPLDMPTSVQRFLQRAAPAKCLIIETELWPNLLFACGQQGIVVTLVSATLSEKSLHRYLNFPANRIFPPAVQVLAHVLAQSDLDAERFLKLGIDESRIEVVGNLKFDYLPPETIHADARQLREAWLALERPVWVAASTHEGEEQMVLEAYRQLKKQVHDLLLVLVPRHPQRFERVSHLCHQARVSVARFSRNDHIDHETEVVLGDTVGDLLKFIAAADVVFVGGSLVPIGGHNLLEPAALQKCIISGAHTESQAQLRDLLLARDAFIEVRGASDLVRAVKTLLDSPGLREEKGRAACSVVRENQGVVKRALDFI